MSFIDMQLTVAFNALQKEFKMIMNKFGVFGTSELDTGQYLFVERIRLLRRFSIFGDRYHSERTDLADRIRKRECDILNTYIWLSRDHDGVAF